MNRSPDVKTTSAALRLERTSKTANCPARRQNGKRGSFFAPWKRAVISRAAPIDINSFSHFCSCLGVKAQIACGCREESYKVAAAQPISVRPPQEVLWDAIPKALESMPGNARVVGRVLGITVAKVASHGPQIGALVCKVKPHEYGGI
jgi:hypothetical protein